VTRKLLPHKKQRQVAKVYFGTGLSYQRRADQSLRLTAATVRSTTCTTSSRCRWWIRMSRPTNWHMLAWFQASAAT